MKRCACGLVHRVEDIQPAYIQPGYRDIPDMIAFHCKCKSTLSIPWPDAPEILRQRVVEVVKNRVKRHTDALLSEELLRRYREAGLV